MRTKKQKVTARQVGGDDGYSWAVFIDGNEFVNGLTRTEVPYYKKKAQESCDRLAEWQPEPKK